MTRSIDYEDGTLQVGTWVSVVLNLAGHMLLDATYIYRCIKGVFQGTKRSCENISHQLQSWAGADICPKYQVKCRKRRLVSA